MKNALVNLSLLLAAILVCLILAEVVLRLYNLMQPGSNSECYEGSPIPELPYIAKSNYKARHFFTNSHHLRDTEIPLEKPPGTLRIAVVGNSMTIGHAVKQEELCTEVMESDLNSRFKGQPKIDVINAGQQGYSIIHFMPFSREFVYPYHPDFVLYQFCWNDAEASSVAHVRNVPYRPHATGFSLFLMKHSYLFGILMRLPDFPKIRQYTLPMYDDSLAVEGLFKDLFAWEDTTRSRGMQFVMVILPNVLEVQVADQYPDLMQNLMAKKEMILERCRRRGLLVLDLTDALARNFRQHHRNLFADFGHFNARGHDLTAREIENWLLSQPNFQASVQKAATSTSSHS